MRSASANAHFDQRSIASDENRIGFARNDALHGINVSVLHGINVSADVHRSLPDRSWPARVVAGVPALRVRLAIADR